MTDAPNAAVPSGPTQEHAFVRGPRITAVETTVASHVMPGLLLLRIHTDAGTVDGDEVIGHGETYYVPTAVAATVHDWMAQRLLGADATAIESHWRFLFERMTAFGGVGAELRALSAVDLALWDILGQLCRKPIWKLLGGPVRDAVPVYNSSGGPTYGVRSATKGPAGRQYCFMGRLCDRNSVTVTHRHYGHAQAILAITLGPVFCEVCSF